MFIYKHERYGVVWCGIKEGARDRKSREGFYLHTYFLGIAYEQDVQQFLCIMSFIQSLSPTSPGCCEDCM